MAIVKHVFPCVDEHLYPAEVQPVPPPGILGHLLGAGVVGVPIDFEGEAGPKQNIDAIGKVVARLDFYGERLYAGPMEKAEDAAFEDARMGEARSLSPPQCRPERIDAASSLPGQPVELGFDRLHGYHLAGERTVDYALQLFGRRHGGDVDNCAQGVGARDAPHGDDVDREVRRSVHFPHDGPAREAARDSDSVYLRSSGELPEPSGRLV